MISEDKHEIHDASRRVLPRSLFKEKNNNIRFTTPGSINTNEEPTNFSKISSGVDGGMDLNSEGKRAALRQFLIRGASCALPSVFCNEGTG